MAALAVPLFFGLDVARMPELAVFAALSAMAFVAIVQALIALFGQRGWLLALLLLVVQVAAAGFPYPASTTPGPVAALHGLLPMTYAIDGMRGAIYGVGSPAVDALVLAGFLLASILVTLAVAAGSASREPAANLEEGAAA